MTPPQGRKTRLAYIDWMRGLACVLMFQTHCYDSWLSPAARQSRFFMYSQLGGTFPAPLFLFLAGISFALVTDRLRQKNLSPGEIARTTILRGGEILGYGLLFRVQEFVISWGWAPKSDLFRVDILNTIGVSMMLMGVVCWGVGTAVRVKEVRPAAGTAPSTSLNQNSHVSQKQRDLGRPLSSSRAAVVVAACCVALGISLLSPMLWTSWRPRFLPWPLESYINGVHNLGTPQAWLFPIFPWAAFAFAGLAVGFILQSPWARAREARVFLSAGAAGILLIELSRWLDARPWQLYPVYDYWHTSPEFFLIRVGMLLVILAGCYAWCRWVIEKRIAAPWGFSPLIQLGQASLLVYWVHIEFVYGRVSILAKHSQGIRGASLGLLTIFLAMLALAYVRTHIKGWMRGSADHGVIAGQKAPMTGASSTGVAVEIKNHQSQGPFMLKLSRDIVRIFAGLFLAGTIFSTVSVAQTPSGTLPSETPASVTPATSSFEYEKRDVMIAMRDGVKLHTVIVVPKGAKNAPILLTRTPYNASSQVGHAASSHLAPILNGYDNAIEVIVEGGYIRVVQDVRGKYGSEGDYVMTRPLHGPLNPTPVDHSTDTYDTIDWLVKNVPESNGKVGILGISYDGFLPLMALVNPHPALKVSVPMNPMVDGWMGDDWFHNGAFREQNMPYIYEQEATRSNTEQWWTDHFDDYDLYMAAGSAGELGKRHGMEQVGFWRKLLEHPSYDAWWQQQAMDKILAAQPLKIPVMLVDSLWDQEDIYGAPAVYKAIKPKDTDGKVFLVMGPWHHGQEIGDGSSLGALKFNSDTALYFRENILLPFLDQNLKDGAPKADVAAVNAFETGTNTWRRLPSWPAGCASGCSIAPKKLYLEAGLKAGFDAPKAGDVAFDEYIADPAKPVPYRARPSQPVGYNGRLTWPQWLVDDQREASGRPDVLAFTSDVLKEPVKISGQPAVNLIASTSGTDSDWVVKLIDLYPNEMAPQEEMGGYQLAVSMDIFRGRYRESLETPHALAPDKPLLYRWSLPTVNHVFLPGHRIMVQIQSSWFPLYDRNPQTFVPNIFWAKPGDYKKAVQRVFHSADQASFLELPVVEKQ